jgi:beta-lactamase regulating signal transducer with metallopeptidase domain
MSPKFWWSLFDRETPRLSGQPSVSSWANPANWFSPEVCRTLSFVLLHSLWEGVILAALLWFFLRWVPARKTSTRYALSSLCLLAFVMSSCITYAVLNLSPRQPNSVGSQSVDRAETETAHRIGAASDHSEGHEHDTSVTQLEHNAPSPKTETLKRAGWTSWPSWVTWAWLVGAIVMLGRVGASLFQTRRLVRESSPLPDEVAGPFHTVVQELCHTFRIGRKVRLACSDWLNVPAVCGTIWPVLLMPTAMLTGIPLEQWRVILAHELAHVRRHDYLINVFQMVIEAVFYFNPAVWWISRQMRSEREACCDALAVRVTGQPLTVARALVNVAAWSRQGNGQSPKALVAWQSAHGNASPGELTDRVKRIAQPNSSPRLRMPWYSLSGILVTSYILFLCLQLGADVAVKTVARILSPRERIERLIALNYELTGDAPAEENVAVGGSNTEPIKAEPIKLTGVLTTADGSKLPANVQLNNMQLTKNSTSQITLSYQVQDDSTANFSVKCEHPCALYVTAYVDGYAPTVVGPIMVKRNQKSEPLKIALERGFPAAIRLVDSRKKPIANAKVSASVQIKYQSMTSGVSAFASVESDTQGLIKIEHAQGKLPYNLSVDAPGFQWGQTLLTLRSGQTTDWEVPRARPTTGQIVSNATNQPIVGAELLVIEARISSGPGNTYLSGSGDPRPTYASNPVVVRTNADGVYELHSLADSGEYRFYIRTKDYQPAILEDVVAGEIRSVTRLASPIVVKGRILNAEKLPKQYGDTETKRTLNYGNPLPSSGNWGNYSSGLRAAVTIADGVGEFELRELFPGSLTFSLNSRQQEVKLEKSIDDLVLDLNINPEPPRTVKKRKVVFNFTGLAESSAVTGKLQVSIQEAGILFEQLLLPVKAGQAEAEVAVGGSVYVSGNHLLGCWMAGTPDVIQVPDESGPMSIDLPVIPAGAIQGQVTNLDGSNCESFDASVIIASKSPDMGPHQFLNVDSTEVAPGKFLFQRLPLGGSYQILVRSGEPASMATRLSDPVELNEANPIKSIDLQFAKGKDLVVRVQDENQQPAKSVQCRFSFSVSGGGTSHGFSKNGSTNSNGVMVFKNVEWQICSSPALVVPPTKTRQGMYINLDPAESEVTVQLKRGLAASGKIIDDASGRPIRNTSFRLGPKNLLPGGGFVDWLEGKTNADGEFQLNNLEPQVYRLFLEGADPVGQVYTTRPDGRYSISGNAEYPAIEGGSATPVEIRVQLRPDSRLMP